MSQPAVAAPLSPEWRPIRVMIVDDSLVIRGVIARILKGLAGVEVVASVSNGMLAVERAATWPATGCPPRWPTAS